MPKMFLLKKAMMTLYSCGKTSGAVLHAGEHHTEITPVEEGYVLQDSYCSSPIGSRDIDNEIISQLTNDNVL